MNKLLLLIGVLLLANYTTEAQNKEAKRMLDAISEKYDGYSSIDIHFDLLISYPQRPDQNQSARIVQQGNKFLFTSEDQDIYGDGTDVWLYLKDRDEVQLNNYDDDDELGLMTPRDLLKQYKSDQFEYDLVNKTDESLFIEFKPLSRDSEYSKYRVEINKKDKDFEKVEAFGKDGSRIIVSLAKMSTNNTYSNDFFTFDKTAHPGVYIEDLRID